MNYCQTLYRSDSTGGLSIRKAVFAVLLCLSAVHNAGAQALPPGCGSLSQSWGPFDYRADRYIPEPTYRSHAALLAIVENAHFTPAVEALIRGKTGARPSGDLSYTLGIFPNHHRALISISNLSLKEKTPQPADLRYSVECYFQRAIAFRPDDNMVRMVYANYLLQIDKRSEAEAQIDTVAMRDPDSAFTQRNLGLLYFETKNYEKSLAHAHKAIELGLNTDVLTEKLKSVGKWQDPQPTMPLNKD